MSQSQQNFGVFNQISEKNSIYWTWFAITANFTSNINYLQEKQQSWWLNLNYPKSQVFPEESTRLKLARYNQVFEITQS